MFENVFFLYDEEKFVLKDVLFIIKVGEIIVFVGEIGVGKIIIINFIVRFYDF